MTKKTKVKIERLARITARYRKETTAFEAALAKIFTKGVRVYYYHGPDTIYCHVVAIISDRVLVRNPTTKKSYWIDQGNLSICALQ